MKFIRKVTEDEMIAQFLLGEFSSARFGETLRSCLSAKNLPSSIVTQPRLNDVSENEVRHAVLTETRGYGTRTKLFDGFPNEADWSEVNLSRDDLTRVKYINYSYWIALTQGSRSPADAASLIESGVEIFGVSNEPFIEAAEAVKTGTRFARSILVKGSSDTLVILEGHLRFTAYALARDATPEHLPALLGTSPEMKRWSLF